MSTNSEDLVITPGDLFVITAPKGTHISLGLVTKIFKDYRYAVTWYYESHKPFDDVVTIGEIKAKLKAFRTKHYKVIGPKST